MDATLVLHATQVDSLHMIRHRLDQYGRDAIKPGNVYVWEEQNQRQLSETCLERWTDGLRWGPSRGGADGFLKYTQKPEPGQKDPPLVKRTYSVLMYAGGMGPPRKCYVVSYISTCAETNARLASIDTLPALPQTLPPDWYRPWRVARRRGRKAQAQDEAARASALPARSTGGQNSDRLLVTTYTRPAYDHSQSLRPPYDRYSYQARPASGAPSSSPMLSEASTEPAYADATLPIVAPQPIHTGILAYSGMRDPRRTVVPDQGSASLAEQGRRAPSLNNIDDAPTTDRGTILVDNAQETVSAVYRHSYPSWLTPRNRQWRDYDPDAAPDKSSISECYRQHTSMFVQSPNQSGSFFDPNDLYDQSCFYVGQSAPQTDKDGPCAPHGIPANYCDHLHSEPTYIPPPSYSAYAAMDERYPVASAPDAGGMDVGHPTAFDAGDLAALDGHSTAFDAGYTTPDVGRPPRPNTFLAAYFAPVDSKSAHHYSHSYHYGHPYGAYTNAYDYTSGF